MNKNKTYDKLKNQTDQTEPNKNFFNSSSSLPKKRFEFDFRNQKVVFEIDHLATKGDKSILCRYGDTTVLTVLTIRQLAELKTAFFPLTITFEERFYSIGRIPSMFSKREGKPSYDAVTTARLIDRSLRSFFELPASQEVHIANLVLTVDSRCDPRMVAAWNSILVCFLSPYLPHFDTPLAMVVQQTIEENFNLAGFNPLSSELVLSATEEKIVMLEAKGKEIGETKILSLIDSAHHEVHKLIRFFRSIANCLGVKKVTQPPLPTPEIENRKLAGEINSKLTLFLSQTNLAWIEKEKRMKECRETLIKEYKKHNPQWEEEKIKSLVEQVWDEVLRGWMDKFWKEKKIRLDGRRVDQIRPLEIQIDYLPNTHGSALFARGETKVLSIATIGKISEKQLVDNIFARSSKYFIHHYNFPPFAVNEIVSYRTVSRREIGHGELVEDTFDYLISPSDTFPYTIRVVSEVLASDGSSCNLKVHFS